MTEDLGRICSQYKVLGRVVKELINKEKGEKDVL